MTEQIVYQNETYTITKKGGEKSGTIDAPYAILDIGLSGLESPEMPHLFAHKKDHDIFIQSAIERLQAIKDKYPDETVEKKPKIITP